MEINNSLGRSLREEREKKNFDSTISCQSIVYNKANNITLRTK